MKRKDNYARHYYFGFLTATFTKRLISLSYSGNMGNNDESFVNCVNGLLKANENRSIDDMDTLRATFRKQDILRKEGSPDYWYLEEYRLTPTKTR